MGRRSGLSLDVLADVILEERIIGDADEDLEEDVKPEPHANDSVCFARCTWARIRASGVLLGSATAKPT